MTESSRSNGNSTQPRDSMLRDMTVHLLLERWQHLVHVGHRLQHANLLLVRGSLGSSRIFLGVYNTLFRNAR
jgi:hypothetical protein